MSKFTLIVFVFLFTTRVLNGAPFITTNQTTTNSLQTPNTKTYDTSVCPDNCTFVFSQDSVITAQKTLEKFLHKRKSMLIYVTLYQKNLTLQPVDQEKQNQIREWQWTLTENLWYVNLPIDLDYASFHITYYGESRIRLDIEAVDSNCCTIGEDAVNKVRDRLWFDVFANKSGSLLCNRYFDNQDWKTSFFAVTTVWIGYDLLCVAPDVDKNYSEKSDTTATLLIPLFCFFIALYYPLLNKIIENASIQNHLERVKSKKGMKLMDYKEGDLPFGYRRIMLKYFFQTNLLSEAPYIIMAKMKGAKKLQSVLKLNMSKEDKLKFIDYLELEDEIRVQDTLLFKDKGWLVDKLRFVPLFRLTILYFLVYLFMTTVPMILEYVFDKEELTDFDTIYKLGLPPFHFGETTHVTFKTQMLITCFLLLPLIVFAKFYATYQFSENADLLFFISLSGKNKYKVDEIMKDIENTDNKDISEAEDKDKNKLEDKDKNKSEDKDKNKSEDKDNNKSENKDKNKSEDTDINKAEDKDDTQKPTVLNIFINAILKFEFYAKFIKRFNLLFSAKFWKHIWEESGRETQNCECTNKFPMIQMCCRYLVQFTIFNINVLLIVPMCAFPTFWFMLFPVINRIRRLITKTKSGSVKNTKESKSGNTEQKGTEDKNKLKSKNTEQTGTDTKEEKSGNTGKIGSVNENEKKSWNTEQIESVNTKDKKSGNTEQTGTKDTFLKHALLLAWEIVCMFLLYLDMSMIIFIERSVMYIVFIAITNYEHLLRIVIVVIICAGYLGSFIITFVGKYAAVLKIMFNTIKQPSCNDNIEETKTDKTKEVPSVNEPNHSPNTSKSKCTCFVSEKKFDYVIDHSYAVREHFFVVVLKIVTTVMFFTVSLAILLQSNVFDTTTKLTNIIEFMVISVTPTVVLKCFEKDTDTSMNEHEEDIIKNTENYKKPKDSTKDSSNPPKTTMSNLSKWSKCFGFICCSAKYDYTEELGKQTPCLAEHHKDQGSPIQKNQSNTEENHNKETTNEENDSKETTNESNVYDATDEQNL